MDNKFQTLGNEELLKCHKIAFLCSHKVPDETFNAIKKWIDTLNSENCIICGCLSGIERYVLKLLVQKNVKIILAWSESMPQRIEDLSLRLSDIILSQSMGEGRLLIVSPVFNNEIHETSGMTADARNRMMIEMANHIVVGYSIPRGKVSQQLYGRRNVTYLLKDDINDCNKSTLNEGNNNNDDSATSMGWAIYKFLKEHYDTAGSLEVRKMLFDYLKLQAPAPSQLHTNILMLVVKNYDIYPDLNFPAFFKMWGINHFQDEDWKAKKVNDHWIPSVVSRVISKLQKSNDKEQWPILAKKILQKKNDSQLWHALSELDEIRQNKNLRFSILCKALSDKPKDPKKTYWHLQLAELLIEANMLKEASCELNIYKAIINKRGNEPAYKYKILTSKIPQGTTSCEDNTLLYNKYSKLAEEYILSTIY